MADVALFVDFENIRYGVRGAYRRELPVGLLAEKARKYGSLRVAKAYADFSREHPERFMRELQVVGIEPVNLPKRQVNPRERKNSADIHLVMDWIETLLQHESIETYVLMGGDRDYVRIAALTKTRFEKDVVICAVPGSVAQDLVMASGNVFDPFTLPPLEPQEQLRKLTRKVNVLQQLRPFVSFKYICDATLRIPRLSSWTLSSVANSCLKQLLRAFLRGTFISCRKELLKRRSKHCG